MKTLKAKKICLLAGILLAGQVQAETMSSIDLLNLLIREGVISEEKAQQLVENVRKRDVNEALQKQQDQDQDHKGQAHTTEGEIKVPYVPAYVKQQLRDDLRQNLRADVVSDVMQQAKTERWGMPNALPAWVNKFSFSGDMRLRYQGDFFPEGNPEIALYQYGVINDSGSFDNKDRGIAINVNDERHRLRMRARLQTKVKINNTVQANIRMVTGSQGNPVSSNQTLGKWGEKYSWNIDRAYLNYRSLDKSLELHGGRFKQPFMHTDLVWDSDMSMEGVAASWYPNRGDDIYDDFLSFDPFVRIGLYPLQEINQLTFNGEGSDSNKDKWLYSAQLGFNYENWSQNRLSMALAYYHFDNVSGKSLDADGELYDVSGSLNYQNGNSLQNIKRSSDPNNAKTLYALAAEFGLVNLNIQYDYAGFSPYHIIFSADYVRNIEFDAGQVSSRVGLNSEIPERDEGYQYGVQFGWPSVEVRGNWRVSMKYRYLEGDAVIDAFADSDFLLGGTNAKGFIIKADYAIMDGVYVSMKYLTADEADQQRFVDNANYQGGLGVDTLQLDINAKF